MCQANANTFLWLHKIGRFLVVDLAITDFRRSYGTCDVSDSNIGRGPLGAFAVGRVHSEAEEVHREDPWSVSAIRGGPNGNQRSGVSSKGTACGRHCHTGTSSHSAMG